MSWLPIAVIAQVIIGSSAVFDKILLRRRSIEPWGYTFWFGMLGGVAVFLLSFGYHPAALWVILLALAGGAIFVFSAFFAFKALEKIEASETLPLMGALSPVFTLVIASWFLGANLGFADAIGFALLTLSGLVLVIAERRDFRRGVLGAIILAALLLAASHVISKIAFTEASFITGFFWIKMGGVLASLAMLAAPRIRERIRASATKTLPGRRLLYFANRSYAGIGSIMVSVAIFLSEPALVDSTQNVRYLVIFLLAGLVLAERFRGKDLVAKIGAGILIIAGLLFLAVGERVRATAPDPGRPIVWGVTFSQKFSRDLGLDWRENYRALVDDLRPRRLRLIAYWDELEPREGEYRFEDLDWQLDEAERAGIPVLLAVGLKLPRWPECHIPAWAAAQPSEAQERELFAYLGRVVERYKGRSGVFAWQVENEPFLAFGECPTRPEERIREEVELAHRLDPSRPVVVTDSGEIGLWHRAARVGDIFGTTMYRKIYPRLLGPLIGTMQYPLPPDFFRAKEIMVRALSPTPGKRFIVVELQGEPWEPRPLRDYPPQELVQAFSPEYFRETIRYAEATGFEEYYLWGVEWWYWMKEQHGVTEYWDTARELMRVTP